MKKITIMLLVLSAITLSNACQPAGGGEFDKNFVHSVHFWLKNPESQTDREAFVTHLSTFLEKSEYAKTSYIGTPPAASRDVVDGSFTYHLLVTFPSAEAQEKYQKEPAHLKFVEDAAYLWDKVIVYDSRTIK